MRNPIENRKDLSITQLPKAIAKEFSSEIAQEAEEFMAQVNRSLKSLPPTLEDNPDEWSYFNQKLQHLQNCDLALMANLKLTLRDGLIMFEKYEDQVTKLGNQELVEALENIPKILRNYYQKITSQYKND